MPVMNSKPVKIATMMSPSDTEIPQSEKLGTSKKIAEAAQKAISNLTSVGPKPPKLILKVLVVIHVTIERITTIK